MSRPALQHLPNDNRKPGFQKVLVAGGHDLVASFDANSPVLSHPAIHTSANEEPARCSRAKEESVSTGDKRHGPCAPVEGVNHPGRKQAYASSWRFEIGQVPHFSGYAQSPGEPSLPAAPCAKKSVAVLAASDSAKEEPHGTGFVLPLSYQCGG